MITTIFKTVLLKSYKHHFECSVITLIFFSCVMFTLDAELGKEGYNPKD